MDYNHFVGRNSGEGPQTPEDWMAQFRQQIEEVRSAADEWAVRWHEPEGRFVSALIGALQTQSKLFIAAEESLKATVQLGRDQVEVELQTARKLRETVEGLVVQTRNVKLLAIVQQENAIQQMIKETLPKFAESLKGALVIREARWNRRMAWGRFGLSGLAFLTVFGVGYGLSSWSNHARLAGYDRCLTALFSSGGHVYCRFDDALTPEQAATAKPPEASE